MGGALDPLREVTADDAAIRWSAVVLAESGGVVDSLAADDVLPTASIGKIFLLLSVLEGVGRGTIDPTEVLPVDERDHVSDSGLLQYLDRRDITVLDLCRFVGAVSDNLATNVLLRHVGLDRVRELTAELGISRSALHDSVRDVRGPQHTPYLSSGCASELAGLVRRIAVGEAVNPMVSTGVADLLRLNTDLSMVAAAFGLDPLAHVAIDVGVRLFNKTGTQDGTRADVGWFEGAGQGSGVAYAVIARFDDSSTVRRVVLDAMRAVGAAMLTATRG